MNFRKITFFRPVNFQIFRDSSGNTQSIFKIKVAYESYGNSEENEVSHVQIEACIPDLEGKIPRSF